jgi:hypothetical protein
MSRTKSNNSSNNSNTHIHTLSKRHFVNTVSIAQQNGTSSGATIDEEGGIETAQQALIRRQSGENSWN